MVFIPESVLDPSFHLSFFTVLGLSVLTREFGGSIRRWQGDKSLFVKGLSYCLGIATVSGIATLVALPFTAFHFQMVTVVGVITNMLAIPLMTFVIMPFIVLIYMAFPLTIETSLLFRIVEYGVQGLIALASWGDSIDSGVLFSDSMTTPAFCCFFLGLLWCFLWKHPWRWLGLVGLGGGLVLFLSAADPDIFIDGDRSIIALRTADGTLSLSRRTRSSYTIDTWRNHNARRPLAAEWPERGTTDTLSCDPVGCLYHYRGHRVALVRKPAALQEDCQNASLVIALFPIEDCPAAAVIDSVKLYADGAHIVYLESNRPIRIVSVRSWRGSRPWTSY